MTPVARPMSSRGSSVASGRMGSMFDSPFWGSLRSRLLSGRPIPVMRTKDEQIATTYAVNDLVPSPLSSPKEATWQAYISEANS